MGKLKDRENSKTYSKNFWQKARLMSILLGVFIFAQTSIQAQSSSCDSSPFLSVTKIEADFFPIFFPNGPQGSASFDVLRNGNTTHIVTLFLADVPSDTEFKIYFNGKYIADLQENGSREFELWYWYATGEDIPIARVGDFMEVTKNGEFFASANYVRKKYEFEQVYGYFENGVSGPCSRVNANIYLPPAPLTFQMESARVYASEPITKISLHEPPLESETLGTEIFEFSFSELEPEPPWHVAKTHASSNSVKLTEHQFSLLRQGLLSIVVFTDAHSGGYSEIPLITQGINSSGDFEGDGIADLAVFRPSEQNWYVQFSSDNQVQTVNLGLATDKLVVGDYDSDNKADITTFQSDNPDYPGRGIWQILQSSDNTLQTYQWGLPDDIPLAVDIDRNNTSDLGIFRPSTGTWYILRMGDIIKPLTNNPDEQNYVMIQWGTTGDIPLTGDFNNDGIDELIAFRPSEGNWYIYDTANDDYKIFHWGLDGDIPIAKDFDGDGKVDLTVYRPSEGNWYIQNSLDNSLMVRKFGLSDDIPVAADYDKDSVADIAVFRPSNGTWYKLHSSDNSVSIDQFGLNGDIPATAQR